MIVEVFKEYEGGLLLFNAVYPDKGWRFDSYNQRDGETNPPYRESGWISAAAPAPEDRPDTIYFNSKPGRYKLKSTVQNVVIDMKPPELVSWNGKFTVFKGEKWSAEFVIKDDSGIDSGVYEIASDGTTLARSTRQQSQGPAYYPVLDPDGRDNGVEIIFEHSQNDDSLYRIKLEIDPSKIPTLVECDDYINYARFSLKVYDIAGNEIDLINPSTFPRTFAVYRVDRDDILSEVRKLTLSFMNTYPPGLLVGSDVIGKTTIVVTNKNLKLANYGFKVVFGLKPDSVGYLAGIAGEPEYSLDKTYYTQTRDVDGIDSTGSVKAFAYLDGTLGNVSCVISGETISVEIDDDLAQDIKGATYVEGELGPFISECADNRRKLYIDPFVPDILKGEGIFGLCKIFENYLNTIYTPMEGDCRIGILEKIHRISEFKDPRECEPRLLTRFADEHGSELKFNREEVEQVAEILQKYTSNEDKIVSRDDLLDKIYRRYYEILPYIDMWKGTSRAFDLIYRVLGLRVELFPLWEGPDHKMVREDKAKDDYWLSTHLEVEVHGEYSDEDLRVLSNFSLKAAKSILQITRVIENASIVDDLVDDGLLNLTLIDLSGPDENLKPEMAIFSWKNEKIPRAKAQTRDLEVYLPLDAQAIFYKDYVATKKADTNPAFWFSRWGAMRDTYGPIQLQFAYGEVDSNDGSLFMSDPSSYTILEPYSVEIRRDRVVLHLEDNEQNRQNLSSWNSWTTTQDSTLIAFKTYRSEDYSTTLENFCTSIDFDNMPRMRQTWTEQNVPADNRMKHDFEDGRGKVSALPSDTGNLSDTVKLMKQNSAGRDTGNLTDTVTRMQQNAAGRGTGNFEDTVTAMKQNSSCRGEGNLADTVTAMNQNSIGRDEGNLADTVVSMTES